jgi:hypothetical protein
MRPILPWVGSARRLPEGQPVLEVFYAGLLVVVFLFVTWFSVYVVYKLYQGQK